MPYTVNNIDVTHQGFHYSMRNNYYVIGNMKIISTSQLVLTVSILTTVSQSSVEQPTLGEVTTEFTPPGNIGYAVVGAIGGLMVVMAVAVGMIIFLLLVVKRGQKGPVKVEANDNDPQAFNNVLYDKGEETN